MRKKTVGAVMVLLLLTALLMGCGGMFLVRVKQNGSVYGHVYNGLTRAMLTPATPATLSGTLTYYASGKAAVVVDATFDGGFFFFGKIPVDTPFIIEFVDAGFLSWFLEDNNGIANNVEPAPFGEHWLVGSDPAMLGNVYLFPTGVNPGDVTIEIIDASNGGVINSAGSVLLEPAATALLNDDSTNLFANGWYARAPKVSGTLVAGTVTIPGTSLVLGATYTIEVYGVTGYANNLAGSVIANTASAQRAPVTLTDAISALTVLARSDLDALGNKVVSGGTVTFTFNRDIELDPDTQYTALISSLTANPDTDVDGVQSALAAFTGTATANPQVASNHLTVTVSGKTLTVAVKAGYLSTEDLQDDLTVRVDTTTISLRVAGGNAAFATLSTLGGAATYDMVVRNSTAR
jgi:hypothetical protein